MTAILTFANHKGGCGKTTVAVHVAAALAELGRRVLVIDLDPQGNATEDLGAADIPVGTVHDALTALFAGRPIPGDLVREPSWAAGGPGALHVVGATMTLDPLDVELTGRPDGAEGVTALIEQLGEGYDVVVVDTRPALTALAVGAIAAADLVVFVANMEDHASLRGVQRVAALTAGIDPAPAVVVLRNRADVKRRSIRRLVDRGSDEGLESFGLPMLETKLPSLAEAHQARAEMSPVTPGRGGRAFARASRDAALELEGRLVEVLA